MAKKKATKKKAAKKKPASPGTNGKIDPRRAEVQQIIKNACDEMRSEGIPPRNYVEQLAWLFFLKAFDESETKREGEAAFDDDVFERRLPGRFAWSSWATKTDHPDQMLEFVKNDLWYKLTSEDPKVGMGDDDLAVKFRRIFNNVNNHCRRGTSLARVVKQVQKLKFSSETDIHVLSEIYELLLKEVADDSAGYAGEFFTQRHIVRAIVEVVKPRVGDRVYDPCFGTCGFLGEAADYMTDPKRNPDAAKLSRKNLKTLQTDSFFGVEIQPLTHLLGTMNMVLHGIDGAKLELGNTLEVHDQNVAEKDKYDVILSNPPYGGKMASNLQTNFRVRSAATEILFVQHIMSNLARGGRAAVVIPEGVLFRGGPDKKVREELVEKFQVTAVLSLPAGCFLPYTLVKTNVLFFERPSQDPPSGTTATEAVWFFELKNDGFELKQTRKPIEGNQLPEFLDNHLTKEDSENSWAIPVQEIIENNYSLNAKNPNRSDDYEYRPALELVQSIKAKEERALGLLGTLEEILG